jgi:hypothetical protein
MRFQEGPHMNFTYCLQATEGRRRNARGCSQQLLAVHAGRTGRAVQPRSAGHWQMSLLPSVVAPSLLGPRVRPTTRKR